MEKQIIWMGSSLNDLKDFPKSALKEAGRALGKVQAGHEPDDWKPFETVGPGTKEVRVATEGKQFRVFYVAKFEEAIFVLHSFVKKTQKTTQHDIDIGKERYKAALRWRKDNERKQP
jgi:phage-related protein